jgi:O-antigen/teichoic acid export membrane protein
VSRIRTNTLSLGSSFFVTAFLALAQVKLITNFLSQTDVGVWSAVTAVGALLTAFSELGMPQVLVRYGAKYDVEDRLARLERLHNFTLAVYLGAMVVVVGVLIVAGPLVARLLGGSEVNRWLLVLGYFAWASGTLRALNNASFRGLRRMPIMAGLEITFSLVVTLAYFLMRHYLSVHLALTAFLGTSLLVGLAGHGLLIRLLAALRGEETVPAETSPIFPEIRRFWGGAAAAGVLLIFIEQLDKTLIAGLVSFTALAIFHVAARLALFARRLLYVPFQVMYPEITHKWEGSRRQELPADMELFIKLELGLGLMLMVFLTLFARPLLLLVSTPEFLPGAPVLWVFTAVVPFLCLYQPLILFLRAIGSVWYAFAADCTWLVIYLVLGSFFVRPLGLPGFVAGQVVASVVVLTYALTIFRRLGLPRPPTPFFLKRLALAAVVWALAVAAGSRLPALPWWAMGALALALAVLGNFLLVRGGFLTRREEQRAVAMLAGSGPAGRAAQFLLAWPRGGVRALTGER